VHLPNKEEAAGVHINKMSPNYMLKLQYVLSEKWDPLNYKKLKNSH